MYSRAVFFIDVISDIAKMAGDDEELQMLLSSFSGESAVMRRRHKQSSFCKQRLQWQLW